MKHPATHRGCQTFQFLARCWCISRALELIEADPHAAQLVEQVDMTALGGYLDLTPAAPGMMQLFVVEVDKEYALTSINLDVPILVARITADYGDDLGGMVIDGWHRVYRARVEGRSYLPAYVLSAETERTVRMSPTGTPRTSA